MKTYRIIPHNPDNPLIITPSMSEQCSTGLSNILGHFFKKLLPTTREYMYDTEFYKLYYLNSALKILRCCKGFESHIEQYNNNPETAFFVTLLADIIVGHSLDVALEPDIPGHPKKPDLYAKQGKTGIGIYFECKNPIDPDQYVLLREQQPIFDAIEDIITNDYSLAVFYERPLTKNELIIFRDLLKNSLIQDSHMFENRVLVDSKELKVKLIISGIPENINKESEITITGLPVFNKGYSYVNGINRRGKNIVFYKKASDNTVIGQILNSRHKVPKMTPYIVAINLTGPRFDPDYYVDIVAKRFNRKDDTSISGILFLQYTFDDIGDLVVQMHYISNPNALVDLSWVKEFLHKSIKVSLQSRYQEMKKS